MAKAAKSADQINKNWLAGMAGAGTKYTQGVQGVTESPMAKAASADALSRYAAGTADAANSGRMANALNAVSLQSWQAACAGKGAQRLQSGAQSSSGKQLAAAQKWAPIYAQASQAAAGISKSDPLGRVRASINAMKAAAGKPLI